MNIEKNQEIKINYFTGNALILTIFKIAKMILNTFTLGIAFPFIDLFEQKYVCKNTYLNGIRLKFIGNIGSIFFVYLKWLFLSFITLGLLSFNLSFMIYKWHLKYTIFETSNDNTDSKFLGYGIDNFFNKVIAIIVIFFTFGLGIPFIYYRHYKWEKTHSYINGLRLEFSGNLKEVYFLFIKILFFLIITFGLFSLFLDKYLQSYLCSHQQIATNQEVSQVKSVLEILAKNKFLKKFIPKKYYKIDPD